MDLLMLSVQNMNVVEPPHWLTVREICHGKSKSFMQQSRELVLQYVSEIRPWLLTLGHCLYHDLQQSLSDGVFRAELVVRILAGYLETFSR